MFRAITHPLALDNFGFAHPRSNALMGPSYGNMAPPLARRFGNSKRSREYFDFEDDGDNEFSDYDYEPRVGAVKQRSEIRRENQLKALYDKINREFPFLAKQGLKANGKTPSLDDLFAMTLFGQPRATRRSG